MRSVSFYCIVMQAICCLKFWNITKSVGTICIIVPTPNSGGLVSLSHRNLRRWWQVDCVIMRRRCDVVVATGLVTVHGLNGHWSKRCGTPFLWTKCQYTRPAVWYSTTVWLYTRPKNNQGRWYWSGHRKNSQLAIDLATGTIAIRLLFRLYSADGDTWCRQHCYW